MDDKNIDIRDIIKKKKRERQTKVVNVVIFIILLVSIVALSVVSYLRTFDAGALGKLKFFEKYIVNLFAKEEKVCFEMTFDLSNKPKVSVYDKNIAQCTIESVDIYDGNGKLQSSNKVDFVSPLVSHSGEYMAIANAGGNKALLFEGSNKKCEISTVGSIINIHVNCNGYVTVVHKGENVRSEVSVYDVNGKECFDKGKAQNYVVFAKLAKNNKNLLLNCIDTSATKLTSIFEFVDIRGKNVDTMVSYEDKLFLDAKFIKDDSIVALTNDEIIYYNSDCTKAWQKKFNTKIYCFDICDNKYIVVGVASDKLQDGISDNKTNVKVFSTKGREVCNINVNNIVKNVSSCDNVIAVNLGREVLLYNSRGKLIKKIASKVEVEKVEFITKDVVVLVANNGLVVKN